MEKLIGLRSGHYKATVNTGAEANGLIERHLNKEVYDKVEAKLSNKYNFTVINKSGNLGFTVYDHYNKYLTSNKYLLLCIHHDGRIQKEINGSMVVCSIFASSKALEYAKKFVKLFSEKFNSINRGIYQRKGSSGKDFYGIIRETKATVLLGEALVLTNVSNSNYIKNDLVDFINKQVETYVQIACEWYGVKYIPPTDEEIKIDNEKIELRFKEIETKIQELNSKNNILVVGLKRIESWIKNYGK